MPASQKTEEPTKKELSYTAKVWQTIAIVALLVVVILIMRVAFGVLMMALAGSLMAVYFHGLADMIARKTRLSRKVAMIISVTGTIVIMGLLVWFIGAKIQSQVAQLSNTLPHTVNSVKAKLNQTLAGQKLLEYSSGDNSKKLLDTVQTFFSSSFGVLGDMYIILFLGIFFTASPSLYKDGILVLIPCKAKAGCPDYYGPYQPGLKGLAQRNVVVHGADHYFNYPWFNCCWRAGCVGSGPDHRDTGDHSQFRTVDSYDPGRFAGVHYEYQYCHRRRHHLHCIANHCRQYCDPADSKKNDQPAAGVNAYQPAGNGDLIRCPGNYFSCAAACHPYYYGG
ncbi:MAG TPA: hypothetical protein DCO83_12890 [Mucilaginibacter sp.]|nr:hypothetical protein [Mucilaginibacter sp.]